MYFRLHDEICEENNFEKTDELQYCYETYLKTIYEYRPIQYSYQVTGCFDLFAERNFFKYISNNSSFYDECISNMPSDYEVKTYTKEELQKEFNKPLSAFKD